MDSIKRLKELFSQFPTVGQRTAGRFVFYLTSLPKEKIDELIKALQALKNNVKPCAFCFNPHENGERLCPTCKNASRDRRFLCVVEKETDLISIENTRKYKGLYFILGTVAAPFKKNAPERLRIEHLKERVKNPQKFGFPGIQFREIIIAFNPTPEGKIASLLAEKSLKEIATPSLKITHLAKGLPVGGELEYADEETLESAFEGRK